MGQWLGPRAVLLAARRLVGRVCAAAHAEGPAAICRGPFLRSCVSFVNTSPHILHAPAPLHKARLSTMRVMADEKNDSSAERSGADKKATAANGSNPTETEFFSNAAETVNHDLGSEEDSSVDLSGRQRLGDYELIDRIGAGGMGVVYRARQLSANREVALKLIRPDRLDELAPGQFAEIVSRFRIEAQAAAGLDHRNIVAVYDVGEAEGTPFFSMRFVPGRSLAEVLRDGPLPGDQAAKYLVPLGNAIQHAHDNGILHRDLKPQNILLDERDDEPHIADFGLAKLAITDSALTRHGEVIGTPQYMSPEQSRDAAAVTAASDVYSLGATMYHLLTGRPPFQAATVAETLRQVLLEPPAPPRKLNPAVSIDLETICLKCLEKEPQRRYSSAGEMAEDVRRFLDHRPIRARRIGFWGRTTRWMRRNPAIAVLICAMIGFLLLALGTAIVGYTTTRAERNRFQASSELGQHAVDRFFTMFSEEVMLNQPGMQPYRRVLLEEARNYYQEFLRISEDSESQLPDEIAATQFRIGVITEVLDGPRDALSHLLTAVRSQQRLFRDDSAVAGRGAALADTWNALGRAYHRLDDLTRAGEAYEAAIELRQASDDVESRRKLANSLMNRGLLLRDQQQVAQALQEFERAQEIRLEIAETDQSNLRVQRDLAMGYFNWANLLVDREQVQEAQSRLQLASECFAEIFRAQPYDVQNRFRLALCRRDLADLNTTVAGAKSEYTQALNLLRPLVEQNGEVRAFRAELAAVQFNLSELAFQENRLAESLELLKASHSHYSRLAASGMDVSQALQDVEASLEVVRGEMR